MRSVGPDRFADDPRLRLIPTDPRWCRNARTAARTPGSPSRCGSVAPGPTAPDTAPRCSTASTPGDTPPRPNPVFNVPVSGDHLEYLDRAEPPRCTTVPAGAMGPRATA